MDSLVDQNKAVSASVVEQAKQSAVNDKAMQDALLGMLKDKIGKDK